MFDIHSCENEVIAKLDFIYVEEYDIALIKIAEQPYYNEISKQQLSIGDNVYGVSCRESSKVFLSGIVRDILEDRTKAFADTQGSGGYSGSNLLLRDDNKVIAIHITGETMRESLQSNENKCINDKNDLLEFSHHAYLKERIAEDFLYLHNNSEINNISKFIRDQLIEDLDSYASVHARNPRTRLQSAQSIFDVEKQKTWKYGKLLKSCV